MMNNKTKRPVVVLKRKKKQQQIMPQMSLSAGLKTATNLANTIKKSISGANSKHAVTKHDIEYANALTDPHSSTAASLPVGVTSPHQPLKITLLSKGVTNETGKGWAVLFPASGVCNDVPFIHFTNGPTASPNVTPTGAADTDVAYSTSSYTANQFTGAYSKEFRIVAACLSIRYLGTTLNAAGRCICLEFPNLGMGNVNGGGLIGLNIDTAVNAMVYKEYTFRDNKWHHVTRMPSSPFDDDRQLWNSAQSRFQYPLNTQTSQSTFDSIARLGCFIAAEPNQPFEIKASVHFEVYGFNVPITRLIPSNEKFVKEVRETAKAIRFKDNTTPDHSVEKNATSKGGWFQNLKSFGKKVLPLIPEILPVVMSLL